MSGDPDDWLTRVDAAKYARRSVKMIDRARRAGRLRYSQEVARGAVVIRRRWVDHWLTRTLLLLIVGALFVHHCHCMEAVHDLLRHLRGRVS